MSDETWRFNQLIRNIDRLAADAGRGAIYGNDLLRLIEGLRDGDCDEPPAPQPEAKAEPDYTCPKCGGASSACCQCARSSITAAANARIAELVRERDEAYRKGAAAAKEACAKRLREEAGRHLGVECLPYDIASHIVRMTEVPDA